MKIIWNLKSIPEFEGLDRAAAKVEWFNMYARVCRARECRFAPIATGLITGLFMLLVIFVMSFFPRPSEFVRFGIMILSAGVGGYLGGVFAMSLNYRAGKKYLEFGNENETQ